MAAAVNRFPARRGDFSGGTGKESIPWDALFPIGFTDLMLIPNEILSFENPCGMHARLIKTGRASRHPKL